MLFYSVSLKLHNHLLLIYNFTNDRHAYLAFFALVLPIAIVVIRSFYRTLWTFDNRIRSRPFSMKIWENFHHGCVRIFLMRTPFHDDTTVSFSQKYSYVRVTSLLYLHSYFPLLTRINDTFRSGFLVCRIVRVCGIVHTLQ